MNIADTDRWSSLIFFTFCRYPVSPSQPLRSPMMPPTTLSPYIQQQQYPMPSPSQSPMMMSPSHQQQQFPMLSPRSNAGSPHAGSSTQVDTQHEKLYAVMVYYKYGPSCNRESWFSWKASASSCDCYDFQVAKTKKKTTKRSNSNQQPSPRQQQGGGSIYMTTPQMIFRPSSNNSADQNDQIGQPRMLQQQTPAGQQQVVKVNGMIRPGEMQIIKGSDYNRFSDSTANDPLHHIAISENI